jgi:hypothetical protein
MNLTQVTNTTSSSSSSSAIRHDKDTYMHASTHISQKALHMKSLGDLPSNGDEFGHDAIVFRKGIAHGQEKDDGGNDSAPE